MISIPVMAARSWASMATPPGAASSQSNMAATDEAEPHLMLKVPSQLGLEPGHDRGAKVMQGDGRQPEGLAE